MVDSEWNQQAEGMKVEEVGIGGEKAWGNNFVSRVRTPRQKRNVDCARRHWSDL